MVAGGGCWLVAVVVPLLASHVAGEILTPPYFNLAEGRQISATATCGEDTQEPELYCKLVGANADRDVNINLIQGQVCDVCDPNRPDKRHPASYAVDGAETWWQSPPLSRSMKLNEVNLTIDFGQVFHVAYIFIRMANSPRPGIWALEKSTDNGQTFTPWQYFADTPSDCETYFGKTSLQPITADDSVICDTQFSKVVPLEGGEIIVSLLNNRPSANDFFNSSVLQEWTKATNVRLRFLRTKTLLGHLMSVARQDPTVTRRYFYSIKDISIGGRCKCNGHADTCDNTDPNDPYKLYCRCQHNTCGDQCQTCCKGFQQKAWKQSKANSLFVCEQCNCFGHSDVCEYSKEVDDSHLSIDIHGQFSGGGVCQDCRHNTEGINCNRCQKGYFRPFGRLLNATDVCERCQCDYHYSTGNCAEGTGQCECRVEYKEPLCDSCSFGYFGYPHCKPCECFINGTRGYHCEAAGGACPCKPNYSGKFCNQCMEGYYDFPNCLPCECNPLGSLSDLCAVDSGNCSCKNSYGGRACDRCEHGYFNYPSCQYCSCDSRGTLEEVCDKTDGRCLCKEGFGGERCDQCTPGYYGYPDCRVCNCTEVGSSSTACDATGKCPCLANFAGRVCGQCSPGYYQFPECLPCECDSHGAIGISCENDGKCRCEDNFASDKCDVCKEGFYNYPQCEDCNCDPSGVVASFAGCGSVPPGELCQCKPRVQGRICNECRPLYWNLRPGNPEGCEDCDCYLPGVLGGVGECSLTTGQCVCKPGVMSRRCNLCRDGFYGLDEDSLFGCTDCGCDIGGAVDGICDKESGQCVCQSRVTGRDCKQPLVAHFFPTLYSQLQFEAEDGFTPSRSPVRYGFHEEFFPGYSWKGYAVFSQLQNEIIHDIFISKPSLYRMVLRYVNPTNETITGTVKIVPENVNESPQTLYVQLKPSVDRIPSLVTVSGPAGGIPSPLVMNPGQWQVHISINKNVFLDYFVLLPAAFYEATVLEEPVDNPCSLGHHSNLCRHFTYPEINADKVLTESAYLPDDELREPVREFYQNHEHLAEVQKKSLPLITGNQTSVGVDLMVSHPGKHVLVVSYVTPVEEWRTALVHLETSTSSLRNKGVVELTPCPYDQLCRQVSTDKLGRVAIYNFDTNFVGLILRGSAEDNTTAAVESVTAIPIQDWSLDYIRPQSVCVKKDKQCVQTTFPIAPDSKKIEFEHEAPELTAVQLPNDIFDNKTGLVYLGGPESTINVHGTVPQPGPYVFVVHYFQPSHPEFTTDVLVQNGQFYEAQLDVSHCPSNAGCRSVVKQPDDTDRFVLVENFHLSFKKPEDKTLWLDYLVVIPAEQFTRDILEEEPLDQTSVFISQCGNNHFDISPNVTGFCRDAVFSLTTQYYDGALRCECNYAGSLSFECETFGGQCQCKENVIGRRCDICKTGYFGFPNCRPCNCPSTALCDYNTGECVCPAHVTGDQCDTCMNATYGYDPLIGCEECNCHPDGVRNRDLSCDLYSGVCNCKENVKGRTCDHCQAGHWAFPHCLECACDVRGTTEIICDQETSTCHCKPNVGGQACDVCQDGTFHINSENPDGCTKCFCFGKSSRCSNSPLYWTQMFLEDEYAGASVAVSPSAVDVVPADADDMEADLEGKIMYFALPQAFLGNKLVSYGGSLGYTITFSSSPYGESLPGPDVILFGADTNIIHFWLDRPSEALPFTSHVELMETQFQLTNGFPVTREQFMQILHDLKAVYIRATFGSFRITPRLDKAILDIANASYHPGAVHSLSVEQCVCPPNYQGLSCEECAPGYYRAQAGPYGGFCVPCKCNGHSNTCDPVSGVCMDCKHNTYGEHCESCFVGYHGNATGGTPFDCLICACPLPVPSNNFATSCDVSEDGERISCNCDDGYYGARCEACAAGFYGRPDVQGDTCRSCNCSGNINPNDPGSCDSVTGQCLRCLNNTYGEACNLCAPGFYGDAVVLKDCATCDCDECGTQSCESYTGQCVCHDNVVGELCDRCAVDHYGYKSCRGCLPCQCGAAATATRCDDETGQCTCHPGATGRTCDRCSPGFWNFNSQGCTSCGCNTEYSVGVGCNPRNGQCECLPGVIGDRCDHCPHRWVLVQDEGCFECDTCTHGLLDTTDHLRAVLDSVASEFQSVAGGYFTTQRLRYLNDTATNLTEQVMLLEPNQFDVSPVARQLEALESDVKTVTRKADFLKEQSGKAAADSERVRTQALDMDDLIRLAVDQVGNTVVEVVNLASGLDTGSGPQVEAALTEARSILTEMSRRDLSSYLEKANKELLSATEFKENMTASTRPISMQALKLDKLRDTLNNFDNKLEDLKNNTEQAQRTADDAVLLNAVNKEAKRNSNVFRIEDISEEADDTLNQTKILIKNATAALEDARSATAELFRQRNRGIDTKRNLNESLVAEASELAELYDPVRNAKIHAEELANRASKLDEAFSESRATSGLGLEAANAYANIRESIQEALNASEDASSSAMNATALTEGLGEKTKLSQEKSSELLQSALEALHKVKGTLEPELSKAVENVEGVGRDNTKANELDERIRKELGEIATKAALEPVAKRAMEESAQADSTTQDTLSKITKIIDKVPSEVKQAKQLPKSIGAIEHDMSQASNQLSRIKSILPDIENLKSSIASSQDRIRASGGNVGDAIERLKRQVAEARDLASRVRVGVTFEPNTFVEVENPHDLAKQSTTTKVSAYFKTERPNGALLYLGNEMGTSKKLKRTVSDDFLSVELENGHPVVVVDLGSGAQRINSEVTVELGTWYQFIVERTGKHVRLTVREDLGQGRDRSHVKEAVIPGSASILNLDPVESKIYVGGHPASARIQPAVKYSSFEGQMEDLVIGEEPPLSLWNFRDAENNRGAHERDKLINLIATTGYRFNGQGHAVMDSKSYRMDVRSVVSLRFKTSSPDGLLFLAGKDDTFLSIELRGGQMVYQYALGDSTAVLTSGEAVFNDDRWHVVEATRKDQHGVLTVDQEEIMRSMAQGSGKVLQVSDHMYIGGFPGTHDFPGVTNADFDGCIDEVSVDTTSVDLSKHITAFGVTPGCPVKFASTVAFIDGHPGYLRYPNATANIEIDLSLRFKTPKSDGTLLLATTRDKADPFSVSLLDGQLVVVSSGGTLTTSEGSRYDDDQWHVISATHDRDGLKLSVEDYETFHTSEVEAPPSFRFGKLLIGGVPADYLGVLAPGKVATTANFVGCIADVTFNGILINLANVTDMKNALVGRCSDNGEPVKLPLPPPPPRVLKIPDEASSSERLPLPEKHTPPEEDSSPEVLELPKTTTTERPADQLCALPLVPARDPDASFNKGFRLGTRLGSRLEFEVNLSKQLKNKFVFSLEFKTHSADGILLYVSGKRHIDVVAVFMKDGKVNFVFNCGSGMASIAGEERFDDGQWHTVEVHRDGTRGTLLVDGQEIAHGDSPGGAKTLNVSPPIYFGGISPTIAEAGRFNLKNVNQSLEGCVRKLVLNSRYLEEPKLTIAEPCSDKDEPGIFFAKEGGYVKARHGFKVGTKIDIMMDVKPRHNSGVLLAVHGSRDYLILQIMKGTIRFTVDNGKGPIHSSFKPPNEHYFCDGQWHTVHAVQAKNVVALSVDQVSAEPGIGIPGSFATNTNSTLYLGGVGPRQRLRGDFTPDQYVGCMRHIKINNKPVKVGPQSATGNVTISSCPTI